jgi:hypothetical protein
VATGRDGTVATLGSPHPRLEGKLDMQCVTPPKKFPVLSKSMAYFAVLYFSFRLPRPVLLYLTKVLTERPKSMPYFLLTVCIQGNIPFKVHAIHGELPLPLLNQIHNACWECCCRRCGVRPCTGACTRLLLTRIGFPTYPANPAPPLEIQLSPHSTSSTSTQHPQRTLWTTGLARRSLTHSPTCHTRSLP